MTEITEEVWNWSLRDWGDGSLVKCSQNKLNDLRLDLWKPYKPGTVA